MAGSGRRRPRTLEERPCRPEPSGRPWHGAPASPKAGFVHLEQQQADVLLRNLYSETDEEGVTTSPPGAEAAALRTAGYVQAQLAHLRAIPTEEMLRARVSWAPGAFL